MKNHVVFSLLVVFLSLYTVTGYSQDFIRVSQIASGKSAYPYGLAKDPDENLLLCGTFPNSVDMDMSAEGEALLNANSKNDIFVAKYDPSGNYQWAFNLGGSPYDYHSVQDIATDAEGNVFICGIERDWLDFDPGQEKDSLWTGGNMFYLAKYSKEGEYMWAQVFGYPFSNKNIYAYCLAVDQVDGSVYVSGSFDEALDFDPSDEGTEILVPERYVDLFLAKYNNDGEYTWARALSGPEISSLIHPTSLAIDAERNICMGGYFRGTYDMDPSEKTQLMEEHTTESYSGNDAFLASYDKDANYRWHVNVGSGYGNYVRNIKIHQGKIYAVGDFMDTVDFDPSESEYYLASAEMESSGFLSVYNTDGSFYSAMGIRCYPGDIYTNISYINDIAFDNLGKCYVIGTLAGTADFDPSGETAEISSTGGFNDWDMFVAQYDLDLHYQWAIHAGGDEQERGLHGAVTSAGEVVAYGYFDGNCDFDPSDAEKWLFNAGYHDLFLAWYFAFEPESNEDFPMNHNAKVHIYPNPVHDLLVVESMQPMETIRIYSSAGTLIRSHTASSTRMELDVSFLPPGWYYIEVNAGNATGRIALVRAE